MNSNAIEKLIEQLAKLPGIGPKSAQRLTFYILAQDKHRTQELIDALTQVKDEVQFCEVCYNFASQNRCEICQDESRDRSKICVVEDPKDISALEKTGIFHGYYHVLGGSIDTMKDMGPDKLRIPELVRRVRDGQVQELIIATNPSTEGEITANYLAQVFANEVEGTPVTVTRIAFGLPVGSDLEYADLATLSRSLEGRQAMSP